MNKNEDFKQQLILVIVAAIVGAFCGAIPIIITNRDNHLAENQLVITQSKIARQNTEVERSREEIEKFIHNYEDFKAQSNVIFKNLVKTYAITEEDFYAPDLNEDSFPLKREDLNKKVLDLGKMVASLQNNYSTLTDIFRVPIPEDAIASINGIYLIIKLWSQLDNEKHSAFPINNLIVPIPHWYPENDLLVPPKDPWKTRNECMDKLNFQIKILTDIRKRVINGEF